MMNVEGWRRYRKLNDLRSITDRAMERRDGEKMSDQCHVPRSQGDDRSDYRNKENGRNFGSRGNAPSPDRYEFT